MALLQMAPTFDQTSSSQETMFEEPIPFPAPVKDETANQASEGASVEPHYEATEGFSAEAIEPVTNEHIDEPAVGSVETAQSSEPAAETTVEQPQAEVEAAPAPELAAETDSQQLTVLSVDDFSALEDRVLRAVGVVRSERRARAVAEERAVVLDAQIQEQRPVIESLQTEVNSLRTEREQVRQRVERLLSQLDALEL
jgi:hypothetical protein